MAQRMHAPPGEKKKWAPRDKSKPKAKSGKAAELIAANQERRETSFADYDWDHTLGGEVKGKVITGGHCRRACIQNGIELSNIEAGPNGFYTATLTKGTATKQSSTFFPDDWREERIKDAIRTARPVGGNHYEMRPEYGGGLLEYKGGIFFPVL